MSSNNNAEPRPSTSTVSTSGTEATTQTAPGVLQSTTSPAAGLSPPSADLPAPRASVGSPPIHEQKAALALASAAAAAGTTRNDNSGSDNTQTNNQPRYYATRDEIMPPEPVAPTPTFFGTVSKSFADVQITDAGVDTVGFLEASDGVLALFDLLNSTAFGAVTKDMSTNIGKVRTRFLAAPLQSATLEQLVENETKQFPNKRTATEGLLWLLRGLKFTYIALQRSVADPKEELGVSFSKAYEESLKKFHSFVVRPIFAIAMKAVPYRADFYGKLGVAPGNPEMQAWIDGLAKIATQVQAFYDKGEYGKGL